jgi:putative phosphoribosyl transferase
VRKLGKEGTGVFQDRVEAGRRLAGRLERYRGERPVVLGLPRGGVPVALEVARALQATLDVLVSRKLGAPGMPEYGIGAVAEGGAVYVSGEALRELGLGSRDMEAIAGREAAEVERRVQRYREGRPPPDLRARTVILVDDGIATGGTARAAVQAARAMRAARVVLAAPVVAPAAAAALRPEVDDLVYVEAPEEFFAVGAWYRSFPQTSDEEVAACLASARAGSPVGPPPDLPAAGAETEVSIPEGGVSLAGTLAVPPGARGAILFAHGAGSWRGSPRNRRLAALLRERGFATLLVELEAPGEGADAGRHATRLVEALRWLGRRPEAGHLRVGLLGSGRGGAAALAAAVLAPGAVGAVVCSGGRLDLAGERLLREVRAPTLLVVGSRDEEVLRVNEEALDLLPGTRAVAVVPGAGHLFEEPGAMEAVADLAGRWFAEHLAAGEPAARL